MRKITLAILIVLMVFAFGISALASVSKRVLGSDLVENAKKLNEHKVTFVGEAIGDVMYRGNHAWVNVADTSYPIGIWMKASDAKKIKIKGDYFHTGDTIEVKGTFYRACPQHGGDLDIHADTVMIVEAGSKKVHPLDRKKIKFALLTSISALAIYTVSKWRSFRDKVKIKK